MTPSTASRDDLDAPRAPGAPRGAPLYESHYVLATRPDGGRAVWIRYTAHKEPGEPARGTLWCTAFDAEAPAPVARRVESTAPLAAPPDGAWAAIDGATIGPRRAAGQVADCAWELSWCEEAPALPYLPSRALYDRPFPRSQGVAMVPCATFAGSVEVAGQTWSLDGWRGMVGHNWGADHADEWLWLHATGLGDDDPGGWLDLVLVRVRLGPVRTPWLPSGAIAPGGAPRRATLAQARGLEVRLASGSARITIPRMPGGALSIATDLPAPATVGWDYASPGGHSRDVRNCSIATATVTWGDRPPVELPRRFAFEHGAPAAR